MYTVHIHWQINALFKQHLHKYLLISHFKTFMIQVLKDLNLKPIGTVQLSIEFLNFRFVDKIIYDFVNLQGVAPNISGVGYTPKVDLNKYRQPY